MQTPTTLPISVLALCAGLAGCAQHPPVMPWEKDQLAKPAMQMAADPLEQKFMQHFYSSREAASGGYGVGGGGCGCN